jgi:hypothetical protein
LNPADPISNNFSIDLNVSESNKLIKLHPHDGRAVNGGEFRYRMIYVAPAALQAALDGAHLPHITDPIVALGPETSELMFRLWNIHDDLIDVEDDEIVELLLGFLQTLSGDTSIISQRAIPWKALGRVRELLDERSTIRCTANQLEEISGLDRWTLAREFRAAYGTSPRSFRTMRQLEKVGAFYSTTRRPPMRLRWQGFPTKATCPVCLNELTALRRCNG